MADESPVTNEADSQPLSVEKEVGRFRKNSRDMVILKEVYAHGRKFIDIRTYYQKATGNDWFPTTKGIRLGVQALRDLNNTLSDYLKTAKDEPESKEEVEDGKDTD